ncbi:MAG TPA: hypothetical protein VE152_11015, partial [Acidimicrobiales bacterium]|nr:hypothetical protein [Acidimicrobiales bacterium]
MGRRGFYRAGWLRAVARWATAGVALPVLALLVINQDPPAVAAVPPPSAAVTDPIAAYYQQLGGPSSYLGNPIGAEYPVAGGEGQDFAGGSIYYSSATGPHAVHGAILGHYRALGGPAGLLGFPTSDETGVPDGVGRFNTFAGGA